MSEFCDKGPVLQQLVDNVTEFKTDQKKIMGALIDIAKHQERLVTLADKTTHISERVSENKKDIDLLYQLFRENEAHHLNSFRDLDIRVTTHLLHHPSPETCRINKVLVPGPDGKFDKIQVAVIIGFIFFLGTQTYSLLKAIIDAFTRLGV